MHQLLPMIGEWFGKHGRVLGSFEEPLDFLLMGAVAGEMIFPTNLAWVLDLAFIISSGILISQVILLLLRFPFLLLTGGWCGLDRIHLFGLSRIFSLSVS